MEIIHTSIFLLDSTEISHFLVGFTIFNSFLNYPHCPVNGCTYHMWSGCILFRFPPIFYIFWPHWDQYKSGEKVDQYLGGMPFINTQNCSKIVKKKKQPFSALEIHHQNTPWSYHPNQNGWWHFTNILWRTRIVTLQRNIIGFAS